MAKAPKEKTNDELMQDMCTRADCLEHLTAKAEMARRAAVQDRTRSYIMLASVIVATISAIASACSAYFSYVSAITKLPTSAGSASRAMQADPEGQGR